MPALYTGGGNEGVLAGLQHIERWATWRRSTEPGHSCDALRVHIWAPDGLDIQAFLDTTSWDISQQSGIHPTHSLTIAPPPYASTHLTIMASMTAGTDEAFVLLLEGNTFPLKAHLDELGIAHTKNAQGKYVRETTPLLLRDDNKLLAALSALLRKTYHRLVVDDMLPAPVRNHLLSIFRI